MKSSRYFHALPAYPGGKRQLLPHILRHIPDSSEAARVADPFCGGGAVTLAVKARGHHVLASDSADRAYLPARALIQNDRLTISDDDRLRLLAPREAKPFVEQSFAPRYVSPCDSDPTVPCSA